MKRIAAVAITIGTLVLSAAPASAHAMLSRATPRVGAVVAAAPTEIRLEFSERVEAGASRVSLFDSRGTRVALGPAAATADKRTLIVPVGTTLAAGLYNVTWRILSIDGHVTQGSFSFTVKP